MSYSSASYHDRLDTGVEEELFETIAKIYGKNIDDYKPSELVESGYEDFNSRLRGKKASTEGMFVKIFAKWRDEGSRHRYLDIIRTVQASGIVVPRLLVQPSGTISFAIKNKKLHGIVMQLIDDGSLIESNHWLDPDEIKAIAQIAASINTLEYKPDFTHDSWAIVNAAKKYTATKKRFVSDDLPDYLGKVVKKLKDLDFESLPQAFVHGDIRRSNILRSSDGKLYVTDFSVANYQPRIVELAVVAHDTLFRPHDKSRFEPDLKIFLDAYQEKVKLTDQELKLLPLFLKAAAAVDIMGGTIALAVEGTAPAFIEELQYWRSLGRAGLAYYGLIFE